MAVQRIDIADRAAAEAVFARTGEPVDVVLQVTIATVVPGWLDQLVTDAREHGGEVIVRLAPDPGLGLDGPDARAGWEIGVLTSVLASGIEEVRDADPARLARVRAVVDALAGAAAHEASS